MLGYFQGRWPDEIVPDGEPLWLLFEVDIAADVVLRTVDIFPDGRLERNSLALEARDGFPCVSIVHGPFMPTVVEAGLEPVPAARFEDLWRQAEDKPYP